MSISSTKSNHRTSIKDRLSPFWIKFVKRAQSAARSHDGLVAVQITVFVQPEGEPLFWLPPKIIPLEPKLQINIEILKKSMSREDLHNVLESIVMLM